MYQGYLAAPLSIPVLQNWLLGTKTLFLLKASKNSLKLLWHLLLHSSRRANKKTAHALNDFLFVAGIGKKSPGNHLCLISNRATQRTRHPGTIDTVVP